MIRNFFLILGFLISFVGLYGGVVLAAGDAPSDSLESETLVELDSGTDMRGKSGSFNDYLNQKVTDENSSETIELIRFDEDTRVSLGSEGDEDPSLGLKMGY